MSDVQRQKSTATAPSPRPIGNWLAGMVIGSAIVTLAAQAMVLGAGAAITHATLKRDRSSRPGATSA
jgi:hypothetical protein